MPEARFNFTKPLLEALPLPAPGKRTMYHDTRIRGLVLRVTAAGTKTFYMYRRVEGKPTKLSLGQFPDMSIDLARRRAEEMNGKLAQGHTLKALQPPRQMTVGELWTWYRDNHSDRKAKTTREQDEGRWNLHLSHLADIEATALTRQMVRDLHVDIGKRVGLYVANKCVFTLRTVYNLARDHELLEGINPAEGIKPFPEKSRERRLAGDELERFLQAVADDPDEATRDWILMALYTGARKSNVLAMKWEEIDWRRAEWRIPLTKNGESQTIPLEKVELEILQRRRTGTTSGFVFPGRWNRGHIVDGRKPWERVLAAAKVEDFHIHDLRRTHGSLLADSGASLYLIGKALGHKDPDSTAIYARMTLDPIREAKRKALGTLSEST